MAFHSSILRLHHAGDWSSDQVDVTWADSSLVLPTVVQDVIESAWKSAMVLPGRSLFDGPMCRLESWSFAADRVTIAMSRTSYKTFWGTNLSHPELADTYGPNVLANPIGVSPALETADGWLLMGRRNEKVAYYPSRVHPFAGCLEPGDAAAAEQAPNLFAAVERELAEELNFKPSDVELVRLTGLVEDVRLRQPELIFRVKARLSRAQIESQLDDAEHHAVVAIEANPRAVEQAIASDQAMTPVGLASLLLWGRVTFGEDWFKSNNCK